MNSEIVSIIIPAYNCENVIVNSLEDLLQQSYSELEIIIVDDGSTDRTLEVINSYAKKDRRVHIYSQCNSGPGVARNEGIDKATGAYVMFLDADDRFEKKLVERMLCKIKENNAEIAICHARYWDVDNEECKTFFNALNDSLVSDKKCIITEDISDELFQLTAAFAWNKMFRLDFIINNNIRFADKYSYEDLLFVMMALALSQRITIVEDELITYRISNNGSLTSSIANRWKDELGVLSELKDALVKRGLDSKYKKTYINRVMSTLYVGLTQFTNHEALLGLYEYYSNKIKSEIMAKPYEYWQSEQIANFCAILNECENVIDIITKYRNYSMKKSDERFRKMEKKKIWAFPFEHVSKKSKIILYGAGHAGQDYKKQIEATRWCEIVLWVDKNYEYYQKKGLGVNSTSEIFSCQNYDYIVVGVSYKSGQESIKKKMLDMGIVAEKIVVKDYDEEIEYV